MNAKARAIRTLYRAKYITVGGVRQAVLDGLITADDYKEITGNDYQ